MSMKLISPFYKNEMRKSPDSLEYEGSVVPSPEIRLCSLRWCCSCPIHANKDGAFSEINFRLNYPTCLSWPRTILILKLKSLYPGKSVQGRPGWLVTLSPAWKCFFSQVMGSSVAPAYESETLAMGFTGHKA